MPVTKGFLLNFRWGVNFPRNFGSKMPSLTVNKIGLERVEEGKEKKNNNDDKKQMRDSSGIDLKLLKGMCFIFKYFCYKKLGVKFNIKFIIQRK